jgi:hypothetical protein
MERRHEHIPVGDKAKRASFECHAITANLDIVRINTAQALAKMGGQ